MPRPMKCRKVCQMPRTREFHPAGGSPRKEAVVLTVDEYEAVRLIDRQGFSQEECSAYMQVARSTVQSIYNSARKKLAEMPASRKAFCTGVTVRDSRSPVIISNCGRDKAISK